MSAIIIFYRLLFVNQLDLGYPTIFASFTDNYLYHGVSSKYLKETRYGFTSVGRSMS